MYETINDELRANFYNNSEIASLQANYEKLVNNNTMTSFAAATELLNLYYKK